MPVAPARPSCMYMSLLRVSRHRICVVGFIEKSGRGVVFENWSATEGPSGAGGDRQACRGKPYDLVVLGAARRRFFEGMVLGTTTLRTVRHAPCPVLTIGTEPERSPAISSNKEISRASFQISAIWIRLDSESPFEGAVSRLEAGLKNQGFGVLCKIDIQAKLKESSASNSHVMQFSARVTLPWPTRLSRGRSIWDYCFPAMPLFMSATGRSAWERSTWPRCYRSSACSRG